MSSSLGLWKVILKRMYHRTRKKQRPSGPNCGEIQLPLTHNADVEWLGRVKEELTGIPTQEPISITVDDVTRIIADLPNCNAPGPDGIQAFG